MIRDLLTPHPELAPSKKLRGKRGYFRGIVRSAETRELDLSPTSWFDGWHEHVDWHGYGNADWRLRDAHLRALAAVFDVYVHRLASFPVPHQVWMLLSADDAGFDAVYIHSANPHDSDFPAPFPGVQWGVPELIDYFERILPGYRFRAGAQTLEGEQYYYVYSPDHGVPLEGPSGTEQAPQPDAP